MGHNVNCYLGFACLIIGIITAAIIIKSFGGFTPIFFFGSLLAIFFFIIASYLQFLGSFLNQVVPRK